jgi:ribose transport system substrate-binding protein
MTSRRAGVGLAAVAATSLLLAGCGGGQVGQTGGGNTPAAGNKNLVLVPGITNEPFYISMQCGAQEEAAKLGYHLDTQAPQKFDPSLQTPIVNALGANKPAALLIAPTDDVAMATPMQTLKGMGVKVIEVDTSLQDRSVAASTISSDNAQGGKLAADTLAGLLNGQKGSVLVLDTTAGTSTTNARAKGFTEELAKYPNLKSAGVQFTADEPDQAASKVTAALSSTPDLVGVFATNLNTGEGAATGLHNAGRIGKVKLIGFDASPQEVDGLRAGDFQGLIAQDPGGIGKQGVDQAVAAVEGKPVQRTIAAPLVALTKDDMDSKAQYFYKARC